MTGKSRFAEVKVGIFVLLATAIVIFTIVWAKGWSTAATQNSMSAYFTSIPPLNEGDPVNVIGVKKGEVTKIELIGDSVRVDFVLDKSVKIKKDYKIEVAMLALMGGNQVYIEPGNSPAEIDYTQSLQGTGSTDITGTLRKVNDLFVDVKQIMGRLNGTVDTINIVLNNVNDITGDQGLKSNLRTTLANLESASRNFNDLVTENRSSIRGLTDRFGNTVTYLDSAIIGSNYQVKTTMTQIQTLSRSVDTLVTNLNSVVRDIQTGDGTASKILYDDRLINDLNRTILEVQRLTRSVRNDGIKLKLDLF